MDMLRHWWRSLTGRAAGDGRGRADASGQRIFLMGEDELEDIEILPATAAFFVAGELRRLGRDAPMPDALHGWQDAELRREGPRLIGDLGIDGISAIAAMEARLPRFDSVRVGSSANTTPAPALTAFGPGSGIGALILAVNRQSGVLSAAGLRLNDIQDSRVVLEALSHLPSPEPLIIVDWQRLRMAHIDRPETLATLLS
ncbi:hypothetical protein EMQ25_01730 [Arsenicitalea aurantiaca]|uniref:Uncharacterized protein n=2 Tax=Arsenicitalea aurantiaca TaxID=1783274 RepID=A0A433XKV9_9HYPH|nr:hypothetical protein EMQ25_01730 [Arsenicitalea aurantiaca]